MTQVAAELLWAKVTLWEREQRRSWCLARSSSVQTVRWCHPGLCRCLPQGSVSTRRGRRGGIPLIQGGSQATLRKKGNLGGCSSRSSLWFVYMWLACSQLQLLPPNPFYPVCIACTFHNTSADRDIQMQIDGDWILTRTWPNCLCLPPPPPAQPPSQSLK